MDKLDVMFETASVGVRRNKMSYFVNVNRAGKIAMKLDEGDAIVDVQICTEANDVLLTTALGQCIRFPVPEVRVFKGRDSTGVRGITLAKGDIIISMAILRHVEADGDTRQAYLKLRRAIAGEVGEETGGSDVEEAAGNAEISQQRYVELSEAEEVILTISENGFGKRTSAYEYRITGRGGKGIVAMATTERNGKLIASFPVEETDQIMLVTDGGQLIRCPVDQIGVKGRSTQGVTIFDTAKDEKVVSVERVSDDGGDEGEADGEADAGPAAETGEPSGE